MSTGESAYGPQFFADIDPSAQASARRVLALVVELLRPGSVVDVGCGSGAWLEEAANLGIDDYLGVDGYTPAGSLRIPRDRFVQQDLTTPLELGRRFDLVVSLEVAEHLPATAADVLVDSLVGLGPAILFSAAVPHQGGTHHVNEQWPEYWVGRFGRHGLIAVDAIRPQVWSDPEVAWWYRQNSLLFCQPEMIERVPALRAAREVTRDAQLSVVHPDLYGWMAHQRDAFEQEASRLPGPRELAGMMPASLGAAIRRRIGR